MSVSANENVFDDPQNVTLENDENNEVISVSQDSTLKDSNRGMDKIYVNASSDNDDFSSSSQGWEYAVNRLDQSIMQISNNGVIYVADGNYTNFIGADVSKNFKVLGCGDNVVVQPQWFFQLSL